MPPEFGSLSKRLLPAVDVAILPRMAAASHLSESVDEKRVFKRDGMQSDLMIISRPGSEPERFRRAARAIDEAPVEARGRTSVFTTGARVKASLAPEEQVRLAAIADMCAWHTGFFEDKRVVMMVANDLSAAIIAFRPEGKHEMFLSTPAASAWHSSLGRRTISNSGRM